jgi:hypothetical protein
MQSLAESSYEENSSDIHSSSILICIMFLGVEADIAAYTYTMLLEIKLTKISCEYFDTLL